MKAIQAFILTLIAACVLSVNGMEEKAVGMAFLGIEGGIAPEFSKTLENKIYEQLSIIPELQLVPREKMEHLRQTGKINSTFVEMAKADFLSEEVLNCRTVLYGKIQKSNISLKRYWFFPLWGRYIGTLELQVLLYDRNEKKYRYNDNISFSAVSEPGFCGFQDKERHMPLTVETKLNIQSELMHSTQINISRKVELSLAGLLQKKTGSDESADSSIVPSPENVPASAADSTVRETKPVKPQTAGKPEQTLPDTTQKTENQQTPNETQTGK
jgi:hypothetical protein